MDVMTTRSTVGDMKRSKFRVFWRVLGLALPFWRGMSYAAFLGMVTIGSSVALMGTSAWLISKAGLQPSIAALGVAPVMVRAFGVSRAVFRYLERLVSHNVTFKLLARLRVWFYEQIEPLAPAALGKYRGGDLLSRVVADVEELENVFTRVIAPPVVAVFIGLAVTIFAGLFDVWLAVVVFAFMMTAGTALPVFAWFTGQGPGSDMVHTRSDLNAGLVESIQGMADAVAYGQQPAQMTKLRADNDRLAAKERRMALLDGLQTGLLVLLTNMSAVGVLAVAVGRVEPIMLGTLALATLAAFEAINPLIPAAHHLGASLTAAERLFDIADAKPTVHEPEQPAPRPERASLEVRDLHFRYGENETPALDGLSFSLEPGHMVAVVGPSGAGKSTLVNLLLRFYDCDAYEILLDGRDIGEYAQDDVHALAGVMSQRTHLFNTTIRENIRIANDNATEDDVIDAAKSAQIHDFIESLPDGYMTAVGEGGAALSGGERQRIALARMLLKGAPLMILDEATANLDAVTERDVLESVYAAQDDRALLVITHRLTQLERADEIIVLDAGRVVERGTHAELLATGGLYREMYDSQNRMLADELAPA